MNTRRFVKYRPSFQSTENVVVERVLRFPLDVGRPCAVLTDGLIVTRPSKRGPGALRLFSVEGSELDAKPLQEYTVFEPFVVDGAAVLQFRSAATATNDAFLAAAGSAELVRYSHPYPSGYSRASRIFYAPGDSGSQLYELPANSSARPRWGSTVGIGLSFSGVESFAFHPTRDTAAISFGTFNAPTPWHARIAIHIRGAAALEYAQVSCSIPRARIRDVQWVGDEAWWVAENGEVYVWTGDGQSRSRWSLTTVAPRLLCQVSHRVSRAEACGGGLLIGGEGRLSFVKRDGSIRDALASGGMSHDSAWYALADRYVTVTNAGGRNELRIHEAAGATWARLRVKPSGWPDARTLVDGGFAIISEASAYVDVAICKAAAPHDGGLVLPTIAPGRVQVVSETAPPHRPITAPCPMAVAPRRSPSALSVPSVPTRLSPDWFAARANRGEGVPFAFLPEHPKSFKPADFAIFAAAMPARAREVFEPTLLDAFEYSWRSLATQVGQVPERLDFASLLAVSADVWLAREFRNWGDLLGMIWVSGPAAEPLVFKSYPSAERSWRIAATHWYLEDGTPKVYHLAELALQERLIVEVNEDADDPWDEYPVASVPFPNLGPQLAEDEGLVLLLYPGFGFRGGEIHYCGSEHDEWASQRWRRS